MAARIFVIMPPEPTVELDPEASAMISGVIEETSGMSVAVASSKGFAVKSPSISEKITQS